MSDPMLAVDESCASVRACWNVNGRIQKLTRHVVRFFALIAVSKVRRALTALNTLGTTHKARVYEQDEWAKKEEAVGLESTCVAARTSSSLSPLTILKTLPSLRPSYPCRLLASAQRFRLPACSKVGKSNKPGRKCKGIKMTLSLERLPPEVLIPVLGFLDPADLAVCNRLSKYLKIFIDANREIISANCAIRLGFTLGQSAGDAGVYTSSQTRTLTLGKAIQNQQSALKAYANVQTWHDFVKKRVTIDRNWRQLNCVERQVHYESSVWRFKVDTESGVIISSCGTRSPYLVAVDLSENAVQNTSQVTVGFTSWSFAAASLPEYTHIECSNGYIVHTMADASFAIWKRCAPRQVANFEPENPRLRISSFVATSSHIAYRPHKRIAPPRQINCYKARFPYLVAGSSRRRRQAFVWHIESGELLKEIPLVESDLAESALSYIEV